MVMTRRGDDAAGLVMTGRGFTRSVITLTIRQGNLVRQEKKKKSYPSLLDRPSLDGAVITVNRILQTTLEPSGLLGGKEGRNGEQDIKYIGGGKERTSEEEKMREKERK